MHAEGAEPAQTQRGDPGTRIKLCAGVGGKFVCIKHDLGEIVINNTTAGEIFRSERRFDLFSYGVSHGPLLFRSGKNNEHGKRLDVLFTDARAFESRNMFIGIRIEEIGLDRLADRPSRPAEFAEVGLKAFLLVGVGWEGFVLAGSIHVLEDDGALFDPSPYHRAFVPPPYPT